MHDPQFYLTMAVTGLAALAMVTAGLLAGWRGWLALKRQQLTTGTGMALEIAPAPPASQRIEIADLKERIRKLEAIAAGVDL